MNKLTIGVVIPCYKGHIDALHHLLNSIEGQTRKPDKVIVSCSSSESVHIPTTYLNYSFSLTIYTHTAKLNASQNRNFAISHLNTDIVSFIDADDIMHPQRLEIIEQCFIISPNVQIFLHFFEDDSNCEFIKYVQYSFEHNKLFVCPWRSIQHIDYLNETVVHNSQSSVRYSVLEKIKFREEEEFRGREDTWFNGDVLIQFPNQNAYSNMKLSKYIPSRTYEC